MRAKLEQIGPLARAAVVVLVAVSATVVNALLGGEPMWLRSLACLVTALVIAPPAVLALAAARRDRRS